MIGIFRFDPAKAIRKAEAKAAAKRNRGPLTGAFLVKGLAGAAILACAVYAAGHRFSIAIAPQEYLCLPPYRIWIIDKWDTKPVRGEIFAFTAEGLGPVFEDGTTIVKVLEGMPGDQVEVGLAETKVNGVVVGQGLQVATDRGLDATRYVRSGIIELGRYWFFGKTEDSFDSRYWGSVSGDRIKGKAYPIW